MEISKMATSLSWCKLKKDPFTEQNPPTPLPFQRGRRKGRTKHRRCSSDSTASLASPCMLLSTDCSIHPSMHAAHLWPALACSCLFYPSIHACWSVPACALNPATWSSDHFPLQGFANFGFNGFEDALSAPCLAVSNVRFWRFRTWVLGLPQLAIS